MKKEIYNQIRMMEVEYATVFNSNELTEWAKRQRIHELDQILLHLRQTLTDIVGQELSAQEVKPARHLKVA